MIWKIEQNKKINWYVKIVFFNSIHRKYQRNNNKPIISLLHDLKFCITLLKLITKAWFPYGRNDRNDRSRNDRCDRMETTLAIVAIVAIVAIIWKPGLRKND